MDCPAARLWLVPTEFVAVTDWDSDPPCDSPQLVPWVRLLARLWLTELPFVPVQVCPNPVVSEFDWFCPIASAVVVLLFPPTPNSPAFTPDPVVSVPEPLIPSPVVLPRLQACA